MEINSGDSFWEMAKKAGYQDFSLAEKLEYVLTAKHMSLTSGCDAHVELHKALLPRTIKTLREIEALIMPSPF